MHNSLNMTPYIMPTYARLPVSFSHGEGTWLWSTEGKRYLDALSGIAVTNLGHAHPAVHNAICEQSKKLIHTSNLYGIDAQEKVAQQLVELSGMSNVFFSNSGAEANEAAIKMARLYGHQQGIEKPTLLVMEQSFHGRTMATLSATGNAKVRAGFDPLVEGFIHLPYDDINAVVAAIDNHPNIIGIMVEPIQGEGGINVPADDYLIKLRQICDQNGLLLILDEIQSGMGRTGKFLAFQHQAILPDVCTLAKALGNGVPVGACLASGPVAKVLTKGTHGSTFGGNPLACSAALAVLETLQSERLIEQAEQKGRRLMDQFRQRLATTKGVVDIRGKGLMLGIELTEPCADLVVQALENGLLINVTAEKTIRLLPPLIIDEEQMGMLVSTLSSLIENFTTH